MASENILILSDADFEEKVLKSEKPVLVDFWADWCGPCKAIAPFLDQLADANVGKVMIAKLNVDEHTQYAAQFAVRSIPTLILFKNGQPAETVIGADPGKIKKMVESA
ncbi:MAG: thioredoxin [Candidatus Lambdaproteobacteria bacterium RIFOXYD1_FULL_56_27]|uniref:Thioredoxin n=1 Tax=Candidatus Lambdaproteobacteria bacterium RIFOXYD2_FULL_56_26 TaxID=1817773 RepID=A0A1F6H3D8_9PROT|nr:MAG: thioredoxin [Candidatus Lambdaproteobacteria bacterium RIFOXYC1_FULL_56_13]OGH04898.1 MAG: thioredoxin [Candidatus Lambdaproteobacteria bacterium RIFOXYD2_FULL_56_26]OGH09363.1 MAG: thioredoxin [Candidatus Lambdaproteobacteria bacterium RIFOXYD1_FULL_56_27]